MNNNYKMFWKCQNFERKSFLALSLTACVLSACGGDSVVNKDATDDSKEAQLSYVETFDDLPNCSKSRQDSVMQVQDENLAYGCFDNRWRALGELYEKEDDLPNCSDNRDGLIAYLLDVNEKVVCSDGSWEVAPDDVSMKSSSSHKGSIRSNASMDDDEDDFEEDEEKSSSSKKNKSSSSRENIGGDVSSSSMQLVLGGSSSSNENSSSSTQNHSNDPVKVEDSTQNDEIIDITETGVVGAGQIKSFTGHVQLKSFDSYSSNSEGLHYTSITGSILKVGDDGSYYATNVPIEMPPLSQNSGYDFAGTKLNLKDTSFTECGAYALRITVNATDGIKTFENYVDIPFDRDAKYCPAETPSSSSEGPVAADPVLTPCLVEIATNGNNGVSIATCQATAEPTADLIFTKSGAAGNAIVSVTSGSGLTFTVNTNDTYEVGFWPEDTKPTANVSDFTYQGMISVTEISDILSSNQIYIAATSATPDKATGIGFYPFGVETSTEGNNGDRTMTIKIYKVQ